MPGPRKKPFDPRVHADRRFGRPLPKGGSHTKKIAYNGVNFVLLTNGGLAILKRGMYYRFPDNPALEKIIRAKMGAMD